MIYVNLLKLEAKYQNTLHRIPNKYVKQIRILQPSVMKGKLVWTSPYLQITLRENISSYGILFGHYFIVLGLNTEIYTVNLRIQSKYGKTLTRKNYAFEDFSHSLKNMITESMQFVSYLSNTVSQKLFDNNRLQKKLF